MVIFHFFSTVSYLCITTAKFDHFHSKIGILKLDRRQLVGCTVVKSENSGRLFSDGNGLNSC
jgi:hypothetical protein